MLCGQGVGLADGPEVITEAGQRNGTAETVFRSVGAFERAYKWRITSESVVV